ncbi:MAG: hypothetical protein B7Z78_01920 [Rhodospirillales bacterium 20-60-12]|nr:MAG: hypothetical protein B7Z78_01920 [Rhodospirillales bacterium 20-60-12]HQT68267.1 hypothetical protein [Acetobacteraceae bacterium]
MKIIGPCLISLLLAGCALETPPPSTGYLPASAFATIAAGEDSPMAAINDATYVFAHPASIQGQPAQAALAIASLDAMAGQFSTVPRWSNMSSIAKLQMLQARHDVRALLGIRPGTQSQTVVDCFSQLAALLGAGNQQAALNLLASPFFMNPPAQTLATLTNMPYVASANIATQHASQFLYPGGGTSNTGMFN